jgi:RHS repeat-associated protein
MRYVTGYGGLPLEQVTSTGAAYYYHLDQLGSVRAMTDSTGTPQNMYAFDPYGNITSSTAPLANPFGFAGQYRDSESSLYYLRARYYDPSTGQFISRDRITALTREPYSYAADNPPNLTDPGGNCPFCIAAIAAVAVGAVAGGVVGGVSAAMNHGNVGAGIVSGAAGGVAAVVAVAATAAVGAPEASLVVGGFLGGGVAGGLYSYMTGGDVLHGATEGALLGLIGGMTATLGPLFLGAGAAAIIGGIFEPFAEAPLDVFLNWLSHKLGGTALNCGRGTLGLAAAT